MKQRKEITTKNKKLVSFIIYAIHFIFPQWGQLTIMQSYYSIVK